MYEKGEIREAACWAHVRRKFHDLYEAHASPIFREGYRKDHYRRGVGYVDAILMAYPVDGA